MPSYIKVMSDPNRDAIEVDADALAGIDRGIEDVESGRYVSVAEARSLISDWLTKFAKSAGQ
jgi:predicted transcriptional regulator